MVRGSTGLHGSSLTGPPSVAGFQRLSSSSSSSWPSGLPFDTTGKPTEKLDVPNSMSFFSYPHGITGNMIINGNTHRPTSAPLRGIPACRRLSPHPFPFANAGMRDTLLPCLATTSAPGPLSTILRHPIRRPSSHPLHAPASSLVPHPRDSRDSSQDKVSYADTHEHQRQQQRPPARSVSVPHSEVSSADPTQNLFSVRLGTLPRHGPLGQRVYCFC